MNDFRKIIEGCKAELTKNKESKKWFQSSPYT